MFLAQVKSFPKTEWWRYILGFVLISLFYALGQIPMFIAWVVKKGSFAELQNTPEKDLMGILSDNTALFFALLIFVFTLIGILITLKIHSQSFRQLVTGRQKISWKRVLFSFCLLSVLVITTTIIDYRINPEDYLWNFQLQPFLVLLLIAGLLIPIQSSVEEFVFRGYLMQGLASVTESRWFALLITSVFFGAMHLGNPEVDKLGNYAVVFYIGTGLFLGILTLMDNGMELALGFHAANNLIKALLVTADYTVIKTPAILKQISEPDVGITILLPLIIFYPILLIIYSKKYKWNNWKQRLLGKI